jgi:hypothetical protein
MQDGGRYINKEQIEEAGGVTLNVRYHKQTKVSVLTRNPTTGVWK